MSRHLLIRNGVLALPQGPTSADLLCHDGRIVALGHDLQASDADVIDATGLTVGPGFIDVHVTGAAGIRFSPRIPGAYLPTAVGRRGTA